MIGNKFTGPILPFNTNDPTHISGYGKGGIHTAVDTLSDRDAIPVSKREHGMIVAVGNESTSGGAFANYQLVISNWYILNEEDRLTALADNDNWVSIFNNSNNEVIIIDDKEVANFNTKILYDNNEVASLNWQTRIGRDTLGVQSIRWEERLLCNANDTAFTVKWNDCILADSGEKTSIHWINRTLNDSNGTAIANYSSTSSGITYLSDFSASYTNRSLVDKEYVDDAITNSSLGFTPVNKAGDTGIGALQISDSTASTNTSTGALQVVGGVGIQGSTYFGNGIFLATSNRNILSTSSTGSIYLGGDVNTNTGAGIRIHSSSHASNPSSVIFSVDGSEIGRWSSSGILSILNSTASTSSTSGALQVVGGVGIQGSLSIDGSLYIKNSTTSVWNQALLSNANGQLKLGGGNFNIMNIPGTNTSNTTNVSTLVADRSDYSSAPDSASMTLTGGTVQSGSNGYVGLRITTRFNTPSTGISGGIDINPSITSAAGTIVGLRSRISSSISGGGTPYNLYIDGTAQNYFNGMTTFTKDVAITGTTSSVSLNDLKILDFDNVTYKKALNEGTVTDVLWVGSGFSTTDISSNINSNARIARFAGQANAVNYWEFRNGASGSRVDARASGSDSDIGIIFQPKGTGSFQITGATTSASTTTILQTTNSTTTAGDSTWGHYSFFTGGSNSQRSVIRLVQNNTANAATCNTYIYGQSTNSTSGSEQTKFGVDVMFNSNRTTMFTIDGKAIELGNTANATIGIGTSPGVSGKLNVRTDNSNATIAVFESSNSGAEARIHITNSATSNVNNSSTMYFYQRDSSASSTPATKILTRLSNNTSGSVVSEFKIQTTDAGTTADRFIIEGTKVKSNNLWILDGDGSYKTALDVQSTGNLRIGNDYAITSIRSGTLQLPQSTIIAGTANSHLLTLRYAGGSLTGDAFTFSSNSDINTSGSGNINFIKISNGFAPTAGSRNYTQLNIEPTYNQTVSASGILRGIYYNPTNTSILGPHYSIETVSGIVKFGDTTASTSGSSGSLQIAGGVGVGGDLIFGENGSLILSQRTSDPSGSNGKLYYNTSTNKFRGYQNGSWTDVIGLTRLTATATITNAGGSWSGNTDYTQDISVSGASIGDNVIVQTDPSVYSAAATANMIVNAWVQSTNTVRVWVRVSSFVSVPSSTNWYVSVLK